jgi:hypothetical protein
MADPIKDPQQGTPEDIERENENRRQMMRRYVGMPSEQIRAVIRSTLDPSIGPVNTRPNGEKLYLVPRWMIRPQDRREHDNLMFTNAMMSSGGGMGPSMPPPEISERLYRQLEAIYIRGSDHIRASVVRAADWACVPPEMLAAVLQNENNPNASGLRRGGQAIERDLQGLIGRGSTGLANVKPETLQHVTQLFQRSYSTTVLRPGVPDVGQNQNAETDIYHGAAALRDGLNKAWSSGPRSLNPQLSSRYTYYPFFGGVVTVEVAIRAMGHYNGMGNDARGYGESAMDKIRNRVLYFLPRR